MLTSKGSSSTFEHSTHVDLLALALDARLSKFSPIPPILTAPPVTFRAMETTADLQGLQAKVAQLSKQRAEIEAELAQLEMRQDVAKRRLAAHKGEHPCVPGVWLRSASSIASMKGKLQRATSDETVLLEVVEDVRQKRDELNKRAFEHYARQDREMQG